MIAVLVSSGAVFVWVMLGAIAPVRWKGLHEARRPGRGRHS